MERKYEVQTRHKPMQRIDSSVACVHLYFNDTNNNRGQLLLKPLMFLSFVVLLVNV